MIFYGAGNPGPWNSNQRLGDNKWTTAIFARDADTGEAIWADQLNPHDLYDYDEINENLLLDLPINGQTRPVLVHPGRDGFMFVIDRKTGQIYSADKYDTQTSMKSYDIKNGVPIYNEALTPLLGKKHHRHLSCITGDQRLAADSLFATDPSALYTPPTFVHGL